MDIEKKAEVTGNIFFNSEEEKANEERPNLEKYNFLVREISQGIGFETLMENLENNYFIIPKNQRNYIWTQEQVKELAISLVKGFPIPPLYGYRNKDNQLVILDGQQRLMSLYLYYKSKFFKNITKQTINLKGILKEKKEKINSSFEIELEKQYGLKDVEYEIEEKDGKKVSITYKNLSDKDKRAINRPITVVEIIVQTSDDNKEEIYYKIFGNLNQGGASLKNQELRNGIYQCELYDMLHKINNNNQKWRKIYGPIHRHSRDVELLLRFVATEFCFDLVKDDDNLFNTSNERFDLEEKNKIINGRVIRIERFNSSYPTLLNNFSKLALSFDDEMVENFKRNIETFLDRIDLQPEQKIDSLLLESLYLASVHIDGEYKITNDLVNEIGNSTEYKNCISSSSSSKSNVEKRLNYVYQELKKWVRG